MAKDTKNQAKDNEMNLMLFKDLLINSRSYVDLYTKLVHSESYRNNTITNVINYIPFILDEDGNPIVDTNWAGHALSGADISSVYRTTVGLENDDESIPLSPATVIDVYDEDNTLSEVIDQKLVSLLSGNIIPSLNKDSKLYKTLTENKNNSKDNEDKLSKFAMASAVALSNLRKEIRESVELSKWFPYAGIAYIPLSYPSGKSAGKPNHRKISITPFNSGFDINNNDISKAEWAIVTEKITYSEFKKRVIDSEYSEVKVDARKSSATIDNELSKVWNKNTSYKYVVRDFYEQAITRNSILTQSGFSGKKDENGKNKEINMFGVIDYLWTRTTNGTWLIETFLNGEFIGATEADKVFDELPFVLFSEAKNIDKSIDFMGNIAFKLLPLQNTILNYNYLKKTGMENMSPLVINNYVSNAQEADESEEVTGIANAEHQMTMVTVGVKNTNQANNLSRILLGSQVYGSYLNDIDTFIANARRDMNIRAGITDFMQGTTAGSLQSQAGVNELKISGLSLERDIVNSIKNSITKLAITEAFFALVNVDNVGGKDDKNKVKIESGITANFRTSFSSALEGYSNTLIFDFETDYQDQYTQSILQTTLLPLAMQTGHADIALKMMLELPLTSTMKNSLEEAIVKVEERMKQAQAEQQAQAQAQAQNQSDNTQEQTKEEAPAKTVEEETPDTKTTSSKSKGTSKADAVKAAAKGKADKNRKS